MNRPGRLPPGPPALLAAARLPPCRPWGPLLTLQSGAPVRWGLGPGRCCPCSPGPLSVGALSPGGGCGRSSLTVRPRPPPLGGGRGRGPPPRAPLSRGPATGLAVRAGFGLGVGGRGLPPPGRPSRRLCAPPLFLSPSPEGQNLYLITCASYDTIVLDGYRPVLLSGGVSSSYHYRGLPPLRARGANNFCAPFFAVPFLGQQKTLSVPKTGEIWLKSNPCPSYCTIGA